LLLGDNAAPRHENLPPRGFARKSASAALCREEIGPPGIPLSRPALRWQLLYANDARFEFQDSFLVEQPFDLTAPEKFMKY
jgi:hypothetical protein